MTVAIFRPALWKKAQRAVRRWSGGLWTANPPVYSDSVLNTLATQDGVVGRVMDSAASGALALYDDFSTYTDTAAMTAGGWNDATLVTGWVNGVLDSGKISVTTVSYVGSGRWITGLTPGKSYAISFSIVSGTGRVYVGESSNPGSLPLLNAAGITTGNYIYPFVATQTAHPIGLSSNSASTTVVYDNISVREVGTILTQATTGYKPIWRWSKNRIEFDDTDDKLAFSAVPFAQSDDYVLMIPALPTAAGTLYSAGNTAAANPRISVGIDASGYATATWTDDAGTTATITGSTDLRGAPHIFEIRKAGNAKSLWMDGVQVGSTDSTALSTTTLNVAKLGCLASTSDTDFAGGAIYAAGLLKGQPSASDQAVLRKYLASLSGVTL